MKGDLFKLRSLFPASFFVSLVCAAMAQPFLPPMPTHDGMTVVSRYQPADAEGERVQEMLSAAAGSGSFEGAVRVVRESSLPVIARERALLALVLVSGASGTSEDLPTLVELAAEKPQAHFMAPLCKQDHAHVYFPYDAEAGRSAFAIRARTAMERVANTEDVAGVFAEILNGEQEEGILYGTCLQWLMDGGDVRLFLHGDAEKEGSLRYTEILLAARDAESADALLALGQTEKAPQSVRLNAFVLWNGMESKPAARANFFDEALLNQEPWVRSVSLGFLATDDVTPAVIQRLVNLLGDEDAGADAALAILRLAPEDAVRIANDVLSSKSAKSTEVRRAILLLLRSESGEARAVLSEWAVRKNDGDSFAAMREEVVRWIEE